MIDSSKVSTDAELYQLLDRIDEETAQVEQQLTTQDNLQLTIGPYTVFASCKAPEIDPATATLEQADFVDWGLSDSSTEYLHAGKCDSIQHQKVHHDQNKLDYQDFTDLGVTNYFIGPQEVVASSYELMLQPEPCLAYPDITYAAPTPLNSYREHCETIPRALSPPMPANSPYMPSNVRYLLSHYATVVIDSLSAIPQPELRAPWRGLHLSSALSAHGELDVFGTSSLAKISLLYSLLSLTCFHLSSMYKSDDRDLGNNTFGPSTGGVPSTQYWKEQAEKLRVVSRTAFRKHLEVVTANPSHKQKYKESLMAAMSLVCVGIVSGDVWDSRLYLMQCENIIRTLGLKKQRFSKKALQLHRLFIFISVVERTTFCHSNTHYNQILKRKKPKAVTNGLSKELIDSRQDLRLETSCINQERLKLSELKLEIPNDVGFANLCGVSGKLLEMIADTNALVEKIDERRSQKALEYEMPPQLLEEVSKTENLICNYESELTSPSLELDRLLDPNKRLISKADETRQDASTVMSTCMRDAMYNALLVYFFREVRNTNAKILQHYVHKVLVCLETHHQIKVQEFPGDRIGLIVWPSFIVACEALGSELRQRALVCIRHAVRAGFRNGEIAESVVLEVWRQRDAGDPSVSWRNVVRKSRLPMLLT